MTSDTITPMNAIRDSEIRSNKSRRNHMIKTTSTTRLSNHTVRRFNLSIDCFRSRRLESTCSIIYCTRTSLKEKSKKNLYHTIKISDYLFFKFLIEAQVFG